MFISTQRKLWRDLEYSSNLQLKREKYFYLVGFRWFFKISAKNGKSIFCLMGFRSNVWLFELLQSEVRNWLVWRKYRNAKTVLRKRIYQWFCPYVTNALQQLIMGPWWEALSLFYKPDFNISLFFDSIQKLFSDPNKFKIYQSVIISRCIVQFKRTLAWEHRTLWKILC